MFHMMIYMYKKAGDYDKARTLFALMNERGIQQNTVTYNSLMSFETNFKEVANIYDQVLETTISVIVNDCQSCIFLYFTLNFIKNTSNCLDEVESRRNTRFLDLHDGVLHLIE